MSLISRITDAGRSVVAALVGGTVSSGGDSVSSGVIEAASRTKQDIAIPAPFYARDAQILGSRFSPDRLAQIIRNRNLGMMQAWVDLADEAREKNPHLHSQLALREQSVVETEFDITPGNSTSSRAAMKCRDACAELITTLQNREGHDLDRWFAEFVSCNYYPMGAHELMWARDGREMTIESLAWVEPRRLSYACDVYDPNPWRVRLWDEDRMGPFSNGFGVPIESFHPDKFLLTTPRVRGSQPTREGLFAVVVWWHLFYTWDWRDLMALIEMLGRPPVVGYFSAGGAKADGSNIKFNGERASTKAEVDALERAVAMVSGSLRTVLADTTRLEGVKLPLTGDNPIQLRASDQIERLISKAVNGVDSVSDLKPGARAAVETQERTSLTFWRADCRMSAKNVRVILARYLRANPTVFPNPVIPVVKFRTDNPDYLAMVQRVTQARLAGMKIPKKWAHSVTGIPEPSTAKDGTITEEVLEGPAAPAAPAPTTPGNRQPPPANVPGT